MPFAPKPDSALLIVGHGSTENPDSSTPYFDHADEILEDPELLKDWVRDACGVALRKKAAGPAKKKKS